MASKEEKSENTFQDSAVHILPNDSVRYLRKWPPVSRINLKRALKYSCILFKIIFLVTLTKIKLSSLLFPRYD